MTGVQTCALPIWLFRSYMPFAQLVDVKKEQERLKKEEERLESELTRVRNMLVSLFIVLVLFIIDTISLAFTFLLNLPNPLGSPDEPELLSLLTPHLIPRTPWCCKCKLLIISPF